MAGLLYSCATPAEVALVAATEKTVLQVYAPANRIIKILGFVWSGDALANTDSPVTIKIERQSDAGTVSAGTPVELGVTGVTIGGDFGYNASGEPTSGALLRIFHVHPQSGIDKVFAPFEVIEIGSEGRVGFTCTAPDACNCLLTVICEE